ncbi:Uncharacterized protein Fot_32352 [Forsythia ovata]|uniref:Uncharacterized protein n=1 Tax=Forsythia ovata TaxID=205694 RepID=A0ABD1T7P9_9LAMI
MLTDIIGTSTAKVQRNIKHGELMLSKRDFNKNDDIHVVGHTEESDSGEQVHPNETSLNLTEDIGVEEKEVARDKDGFLALWEKESIDDGRHELRMMSVVMSHQLERKSETVNSGDSYQNPLVVHQDSNNCY